MEQLPSTVIATTTPRPIHMIKDGPDTYLVDVESGEILNQQQPLQPVRKRDLRRCNDVGVTTPWPALARDAEELTAALEPFDWWQDKLHVDTRKVLGLLDAGLNDRAVRTFHQLAKGLAGRNVWFGSIEELRSSLQTSKRALERALADLEKFGLIARKHQGRHWPLRITLHPWYAWRGDLTLREPTLQAWTFRSAKSGGQHSLQPTDHGTE